MDSIFDLEYCSDNLKISCNIIDIIFGIKGYEENATLDIFLLKLNLLITTFDIEYYLNLQYSYLSNELFFCNNLLFAIL